MEIKFKRDTAFRKQFFVPDSFAHLTTQVICGMIKILWGEEKSVFVQSVKRNSLPIPQLTKSVAQRFVLILTKLLENGDIARNAVKNFAGMRKEISVKVACKEVEGELSQKYALSAKGNLKQDFGEYGKGGIFSAPGNVKMLIKRDLGELNLHDGKAGLTIVEV